jgi:hypothetical protein
MGIISKLLAIILLVMRLTSYFLLAGHPTWSQSWQAEIFHRARVVGQNERHAGRRREDEMERNTGDEVRQ